MLVFFHSTVHLLERFKNLLRNTLCGFWKTKALGGLGNLLNILWMLCYVKMC